MKGGNYLGAGIEHNEQGDPTASGAMHAKMNAKRFKKLDAAAAAARPLRASTATPTRRFAS
jgi:hypothetical protein